jgi:GT2 family glycosyltransferase
MNITCVIVTYNRLALLTECIESVLKQTYPVSRIIIIDNHSTDGTSDYLSSYKNDPLFHIITMTENIGGAGGFSEGIKQAALTHADWIWIMDDDTIPHPDTLEQMIPYTQIERLGIICSKVVWIDNTIHKMNAPRVMLDQSLKPQVFESVALPYDDVTLIEHASFVSVLIKGNIPWEVGLPYKEFFIWCDDSEYTNRIIQSGYYGIYVPKSVALHKTAENYVSSLYTVPASAAWKVFYGVRNESFLRRKRKGWLKFFFAQINCFHSHAHHIKKRNLPKDEEKKLLDANRKGLLAGFTFSPKIDFIHQGKE